MLSFLANLARSHRVIPSGQSAVPTNFQKGHLVRSQSNLNRHEQHFVYCISHFT